jgi:hypothetical protein
MTSHPLLQMTASEIATSFLALAMVAWLTAHLLETRYHEAMTCRPAYPRRTR